MKQFRFIKNNPFCEKLSRKELSKKQLVCEANKYDTLQSLQENFPLYDCILRSGLLGKVFEVGIEGIYKRNVDCEKLEF